MVGNSFDIASTNVPLKQSITILKDFIEDIAFALNLKNDSKDSLVRSSRLQVVIVTVTDGISLVLIDIGLKYKEAIVFDMI